MLKNTIFPSLDFQNNHLGRRKGQAPARPMCSLHTILPPAAFKKIQNIVFYIKALSGNTTHQNKV